MPRPTTPTHAASPAPSRSGSPRRSDRIACVALTVLWVVPILVIGIHGEFPLNDDWTYARTTRTFLETGRIERDAWSSIPMLTNVAIGALGSSILGFSFETLRLSGVLMGWLGLLGSYCLCRQAGVASAPSALAAAVVGLNPIYLNLSYSFMTDVPFTALSIWSLVLLHRGLARRSWRSTAGGGALALAAILSRQPGLAIPLAFLVAWALPRAERLRLWVLPAAAAALVGIALLVVPPLVLGDPTRTLLPLPGLREFRAMAFLHPGLAQRLASNGLSSFVYLGLFLSPVVALLPSPGEGRTRRVAWATGLITAVVLAALLARGRPMPLGGNVLYDFGVGVSTLHGTEALPGAPAWIWWVATAVAVGAGVFAAVRVMLALIDQKGTLRARPAQALLLLFPAAYLGPLLGVGPFFDRYLLPVLAPTAAVLLSLPGRTGLISRRATLLALSLLLPLAGVGVLGTRDYLEHNRARWSLIRPLLARGVAPEKLDAGFELDGWSGLDPNLRWQMDPEGQRVPDYIVSHVSPRLLPRFRAVDRRVYRRLLPPRNEVIVLYRRIGAKR